MSKFFLLGEIKFKNMLNVYAAEKRVREREAKALDELKAKKNMSAASCKQSFEFEK